MKNITHSKIHINEDSHKKLYDLHGGVGAERSNGVSDNHENPKNRETPKSQLVCRWVNM